MTEQFEMNFEGIEERPLHDFTEKAYLDYAMYVILDRALPHIGDGLKPVQRRIVYAMSELGLKNTAKYKKSARTVGDVLGKFHPHGDSACYEAMVLMAQDFSYRYPLIDGQGNWGSPDDPKSFAAMRYTESKLTRYAEALLSEIGQGTVDWQPNFDGSIDEPVLLPARVPNVLLNGSTGIAVGMATDIPPHNLREVVSACIELIDNPKASLKTLCEHVPGPDYPTDAEIISPKEEIQEIYSKGTGSIRMRAVYTKEQSEIVITALPHQVSGAKVIEQIAAQMQAKKLPMLGDIRDESDHENPTRIVLIPRSNRIDLDELMSHLFASTDLQKNYRVNLNMIGLNGRPQVKNLKLILQEWLEYRESVIKRRLQYRLEKVVQRLHILDALLIAFLNIDEVIQIIREEDKPKPVLMKRFRLSDIQAEAILDLKLRNLAKLEEEKINGEQSDLAAERDTLEKTLNSAKRLQSLMKKELQAAAKDFGDDRRSPLVERSEAKQMDSRKAIPSDPITVILSQKGWVRQAKGHEVVGESLNYKSGDAYMAQLRTKMNENVIFLDNTGRAYTVQAHGLPSARGQGEPLTGKVKTPPGASFQAMLPAHDKQFTLLMSNQGYGFVCAIENAVSKNKAGKALVKLAKDTSLVAPAVLTTLEEEYVGIITSQGHLLILAATDVPVLDKGKGNKLINIHSKDFKAGEDAVVFIQAFTDKHELHFNNGKRTNTMGPKDWSKFIGNRGERGKVLPKNYRELASFEVSLPE